MKKIVIIPISVVVFIGIAAVAAGILFPDSSPFTRMPIGPGTLGQALTGAFDANGNALNANMLSGVSANDYLKDKDCSGEPIDNVWVAVDGSGKGRCGHLGGVLADLSIGSISEFYGTVNVYRSGSTTSIPGAVGMPLYEGDVVDTAADGTGTIMFAADNSLLRLSTSTNVELRYGELDGNTVAEVILSDGRLWGRILTGTGINLGGGGVVTGVRGTSVDLQKIAGKYIINVIDSNSLTNPIKPIPKTTSLGGVKTFTMAAAAIASVEDIDGAVAPAVSPGNTLTYDDGSANIVMATKTPVTSYVDTWIKRNAESDVKYMSQLLLAGGLSAPAKVLLNDELNNTLQLGNTAVLSLFIEGGDLVSAPDIADAATMIDEENVIDLDENTDEVINSRKFARLECKKQNKTFIPYFSMCKGGSYKTVGVTQFTGLPNTNNAIRGSKRKYTFNASGTRAITGTNKLIYTNPDSSWLGLKNKTIRIEFDSLPANGYLVDFGGGIKIHRTGGSWDNDLGTYGTVTSYDSNHVEFVLNNTISPSQFLVGNKSDGSQPFIATFTSITIKK